MSAPVKPWLDNAILQSVAECYLDLSTQFGGTESKLKKILNAGVNHLEKNPDGQGATRLTDTQITWFEANYTIVSHYPSNNSGFSCTLFKNNATGEYTLSFRSTEYQFGTLGGDWERDGSGAADGDISKYGFSLGQLSSMETFYSNLKQGKTWDNVQKAWVENPEVKAEFFGKTPPLNVTGYSLGAHLSSAFTLLHGADVAQTYNYNAAGLGGINTDAGGFRAPTGTDISSLLYLYNNMMAWNGQGIPTWWSELPTVSHGLITDYINAAQAHPSPLNYMNNIYTSAKHRSAMEILGYLTIGAGTGDGSDGVMGGLGIMQTKDAAGNWLDSTGNGPLQYDPNAVNSTSPPAAGFNSAIIHTLESEDIDGLPDVNIVPSIITGAQAFGAETLTTTELNSHMIEPLMDSLALQALIYRMNDMLVARGNVKRLLENASNTIPDTMETLVAANDAEGWMVA